MLPSLYQSGGLHTEMPLKWDYAAQMCLTLGVLPQNLLKGIVGALLFEDVHDPDHHIGLMRESMDTADFNRYVLGLRHGEPLDLMLRDNMGAITNELRELAKETK